MAEALPQELSALPAIKLGDENVNTTVQQLAELANEGSDARMEKVTTLLDTVQIGPGTKDSQEAETSDQEEITCVLGLKLNSGLASAVQSINATVRSIVQANSATYEASQLTVLPLMEAKLKLSELHSVLNIAAGKPEGDITLGNVRLKGGLITCEVTDIQAIWYNLTLKLLGRTRSGVMPLLLKQVTLGRVTRLTRTNQSNDINKRIVSQRLTFPRIFCSAGQTVIYPKTSPDRVYTMIADSKFACFLDTEGQKSYNTHMMDKTRGQPTMEGFAETYDSSGQRRSDVYKSYAGRSRGKYGSIKANMSPDEITPLIVAMRRDSPMQGYDFQYIIEALLKTDDTNTKVGEMNFQLGQLLKANNTQYAEIISMAENSGLTTTRLAAAIQMMRGSLLGRLGAVRFEEKRGSFAAGTRKFEGTVPQDEVKNLLVQLEQELNNPKLAMLGTEKFAVSPLVVAPLATAGLREHCQKLHDKHVSRSTVLDRVYFGNTEVPAFKMCNVALNYGRQLSIDPYVLDRYKEVRQKCLTPPAGKTELTSGQKEACWALLAYLLVCYEHVLMKHERQLEHVPTLIRDRGDQLPVDSADPPEGTLSGLGTAEV